MDGNFLIFRCFETRPVKLGLASSEQWMDVVWSLLVTLLSLSILAMWSSKQGAVSSLNGSNGTGETLLLQLDDDGLLCFLIFHSFGILYLFDDRQRERKNIHYKIIASQIRSITYNLQSNVTWANSFFDIHTYNSRVLFKLIRLC